MAAVSTSPPPTSQSPGAPGSHEIYEALPRSRPSADLPRRKPLSISSMPIGYDARIRNAPSSPVRVNVQEDHWTQGSNVDIEDTQSQRAEFDMIPRSRFNESLRFSDLPPQLSLGGGIDGSSPPPDAQNVPTIPRPQSSDAPSDSTTRESTFATPQASPSPKPAGGEMGVVNAAERVRQQELYRNSRESDETASTTQQQASIHSSAATSASSLSGVMENPDCPPNMDSPGSSVIEGHFPVSHSVPQFQYHHHQHDQPQRTPSAPLEPARRPSNPDSFDQEINPRRHLTPTSNYFRRSSMPRPQSSYSIHSDMGPRGRSPGLMPSGPNMRAPSAHSRRSPDVRQSTYAELLNVPYPQQAPAPMVLDNSNLRNVVGNNASLLSTQKTLEMYRQNVKKTSDFSIQYSFAIFLISTAQEQGLDFSDPKGSKNSAQPLRDHDSPIIEASVKSPQELVREARSMLQKLANGGYPFAQYYLADGYASGLFSKGKEDYGSAFPLFVLAAKHGHAESAYRTALCYEFGWGARKDPAKAVQFLRTAASKRHPGAMTRLGKACLSGDLGEKRYREGVKWLKLASEAADTQYNAAPYQLGCLYETGYGEDVFADLNYAAELFTQAAELGHPEANYRMGDAYEHGRLNCPRDPALSVHFYTGAADAGHAGAMMGLCAWYMVGASPILEKDEEEAYEWARRSAALGFVKAQYAVGYFTEMGIGCRRDPLEANVWYVRAADAGDERATQRLAIIQAAVSGGGVPMDVAPPRNAKLAKGAKDDKDCIVM